MFLQWRDGDGRNEQLTGTFPGQFFFAVTLAGRFILNFGFIERPLVIGFLWGMCVGDFSLSLPLALFFELFWLDLFPIGSYLPPMPVFPYLLLLVLAHAFAWTTPVELAFPLAMLLPAAYIVPYIEAQQRNLQTTAYSQLISRSRQQIPLGKMPVKLIYISAQQQLFFGIASFLLLYGITFFFFSLDGMENANFIPLDVDWPVLYAIAAIGALIALRIRRAYIVFSVFMACFMIIKFYSL